MIVLLSLCSIAPVWGTQDEIKLLQHLNVLSSDQFSGRKFSSQGSLQAQSYLVSVLENLNVPPFNNQYLHAFTKSGFFQSKQGANVIATIPGSHFQDRYILLSAHYDHLGTKGGKVFNGADDNASGIAALLYYAKLLKQAPLKHSIILLFSDGEEVNLLGAKAFIEQQKNLLNNIRLNINLDMIAGSKHTKKLRFISKDLNKILNPEDLAKFDKFQASLKKRPNVHLTYGFRGRKRIGTSVNHINWLMASDHGVFSKAGIPFIYFGVGPHKNYHSEFDVYANINHQFFLSATDIIFQQLIYLDNAMVTQASLTIEAEKTTNSHHTLMHD